MAKKNTSAKKPAKKAKAKKVNRFYGRVSIPRGAKTAFVSHENKNGFSLGLVVADRTIWLRNTRFASKADLKKALDASKLVIVELGK